MTLIAFILGMLTEDHLRHCFVLIGLFFTRSRQELILCILFFFLGFVYFKFHNHPIKTQSSIFGHNFFSSFLVKIESFEEKKPYATRWKVQTEQPFRGFFWLNCYQSCPKMLPGEKWWIQAKIKKETHLNNPGQLNSWYRLDYRHILGQMNLIPHRFKKHSEISRLDYFNRCRVMIYQKAHAVFAHQHPFAQNVFLALVLGIGSELSSEDWTTFKSTGTAHLMVVSGAHLSLLMMMIAWLVEKFYYFRPTFIPVKKISSALSLSFGLFYAFLSGFGIPVQRAWCMRFLMDLQYWINYRVSAWQSFVLTIWVILIIEPHAIFYPGAYLSFLAVGILMFANQLFFKKKWWQLIAMQAMCLVGLSPLTILWFSNIPIVGLVANLFAIPWVSWIILPLALSMSILLSPWVVNVFDGSVFVLQKTLQYLQGFEQFNLHMMWHQSFLPWYSLIALFIVFIYPNWKVVLQLIVMGLMIQFSSKTLISPGEFWVDILDVGQGLAVLVRTQQHALLYDTAGMQGKKTIANLIVLPYLNYIQLKKLDALVLSHPDLDHIAGKKELLATYPEAKLIVDQPSFYHQGHNCRHLKDWEWDGIRFHFLRGLANSKKKNDHSCVLLIQNQQFQILLTADIEKKAEQVIIKEISSIHPTVLLVPHHGSYTSSSERFLHSMQSQLAIVSVALHNAYHLPHPLIKKRYQLFHIPWKTTAEEGWMQIQFLKKTWHFISMNS